MEFLCSLWIPSKISLLVEAEARILQRCEVDLYNVPITFRNSSDLYIHTLEKTHKCKTGTNETLVLCHGYGQGIGAWYRNVNQLGKHFDLYAVDWLGFGNSSRPPGGPRGLGVDATEEWFIDSLEAWRVRKNITQFNLCGHSLGGYLSVCYAEKYPQHVKRLILSSPVGIPDPEYQPDIEEFVKTQPLARRLMFQTVKNLWENGTTPGGVVRRFGPLGKVLIAKYTSKRFTDDNDKESLADYLYHNVAATQISGECAINELLTVGAWAKKPLHKRLLKLDPTIPIAFIYGAHDWMDHRHAVRVMNESKALGSQQRLTCQIVQDAGHQIHLDNPPGFHEAVINAVTSEMR